MLSISDSEHRVPTELGQESQASSCVEEWNSTGLSSCSPDNRPLVELCVEPAVLSGRCMGVSVPLRFLPSYTGLPSKRYPAFRFLSRADQEIRVFRRVAPTTRLHLEFPRETGLILRCAGKAGNPFQTTQGNRLSCRDQEGRRGSEEAVPGPSVFPSGEPGVSGDFWGSQEGCQGPSRPSGRNRGLPLRRRRGQGPHLAKRWEPRGFSRVAAAFSSYDGDLSLPLGLALGSPIFPSGCEGKLGVALESLQGRRDLT